MPLGFMRRLRYPLSVTETEQAILAALRDLEATVKRMPTANPKPNLLPLFACIDALAAQMPPDTAPDLRHYLQRKSYEKARLWLEGIDPEKGTCRR
ncbi:MAG: hypothetical protein EXS29_08485 [Pedosphaera sp.]|nr:hypothetical protein [Pedosphaera sp.]MST01330.1 hypothetical protein [Pedosphaera sp.]